jgi:hypothetical protein
MWVRSGHSGRPFVYAPIDSPNRLMAGTKLKNDSGAASEWKRMLLLGFMNCFTGVIFGIRYSVMALLPLMAVAISESALIKAQEGTWISAFWMSVVLIVCIEVGYVVGAGLRVFLPAIVVRDSWMNLRDFGHSRHG